MQNLLISSVAIVVLLFVTEARTEHYPFDNEAWEISGDEVEFVDYLGKAALRLKGANAILNGVELQDGVIEFDIAVSELRGFSGGRFRAQDSNDFEHFYIRPHQSGKPDANQYTPVFDGSSGWQLYYGEDYATAVSYRFDEWMHVKIIYEGRRADIFIDSDEPVLRVRKLKRPVAAGSVGVDASNFSPAWYANFEASRLPDDYRFAPVEDKAKPLPAEAISLWQVSDAFDSGLVDDASVLADDFKAARTWTSLHAEPSGITNFARLQGNKPGENTVIARLVVNSDKEQIKGLSFGYSDAVSVYVNGTRLYSGANMYESRDYRYLGTIGLFDAVYLPLKAGDNEVWFAVSEAFGGWGVQAQFDDLEGITVITDP